MMARSTPLWMIALAGCATPEAPPSATEAPVVSPAQSGPPPGRQGGAGPQRGGKAPGRGQAKGKAGGNGNGNGSAPPATFDIVEQDGMVWVPSGWSKLGPRQLPPVPGHSAPTGGGPVHPGAGGAADHAAGGAARAAGAPPAQLEGQQLAGIPDVAVPWGFHGGNGVKPQLAWVDGFWIDQTEVTRTAYAQFLDATGYRPPHVAEAWAEEGWNWTGTAFPVGTGDHPVVLTSWYDAQEYCRWAGKRLPGEVEWQLAALGPFGRERDYPWGDDYDASKLNHGKIEDPNFDDTDGHARTAPVGTYPAGASPFGALDMFGNAWEFTADHRVDTWALMASEPYQRGVRGARAPGPGLYVAVRGGSYFFDLTPNPAGERHHFLPEIRRKTSGFRCAADKAAP